MEFFRSRVLRWKYKADARTLVLRDMASNTQSLPTSWPEGIVLWFRDFLASLFGID